MVFEDFLADVWATRANVRHPAELAGAVAHRLEPLVATPGWLPEEFRQPSTEGYRQHIMYVAPDDSFSIASLVWLPHQKTCIHDHLAWCVVGVYEGEETEVRYRLCEDITSGEHMLVRNDVHRSGAGQVSARVPPGDDIHQVMNAGNGLAISIHVYGTNIAEAGSSIHRRFDQLPIFAKESA